MVIEKQVTIQKNKQEENRRFWCPGVTMIVHVHRIVTWQVLDSDKAPPSTVKIIKVWAVRPDMRRFVADLQFQHTLLFWLLRVPFLFARRNL
jgi:hypothetical protein